MIDHFSKESGWLAGTRNLPGMSGIAPAILIASIFINILSLALPVTLIQVYDRILPNKALGSLSWLVTGVVTALILEAILRIARTYLSGWMGIHFELLVGGGAFNRLTSTSIADFERDGLGTHLDRLSAVNMLRDFYSGNAFQILLDVPFALLFVFAIWYLAGVLALVPLLAMICFLITVFLAKKRFRNALDARHLASDRRHNFLIEVLSGIHTVKSMGMEELMLRRHERLQETTAETNMEVTIWSMSPMVLGSFFSMLTMFGVVGLGASFVIDGTLTVGGLAGSTLLAGRALQPVQSAAGFWLRFSDVQLARERLAELVELKPEIVEGMQELPENVKGNLTLNDVSFQFGPDNPYILKDLNISIRAGETIGIKGGSASGKSTLLYVMMGALKPTSGTVILDGHNLAQFAHGRLGDVIAYMPQSGILFQGTILENLTMFRDQRREAALEAATLLGLEDVVARMPNGFETMVGKESQDFLSGGVKQRIAIARAITTRPPIVLFDEANVAMDAKGDALLKRLLQHIKNQCTIVLVSHRPSLLELADRTFILQDGKVFEEAKKPSFASSQGKPSQGKLSQGKPSQENTRARAASQSRQRSPTQRNQPANVATTQPATTQPATTQPATTQPALASTRQQAVGRQQNKQNRQGGGVALGQVALVKKAINRQTGKSVVAESEADAMQALMDMEDLSEG